MLTALVIVAFASFDASSAAFLASAMLVVASLAVFVISVVAVFFTELILVDASLTAFEICAVALSFVPVILLSALVFILLILASALNLRLIRIVSLQSVPYLRDLMSWSQV